MQLAVLEYLCGGGLASQIADGSNRHELQGLFQEGFGMLRSLTEDLVSCGHSIVTVVDPQAMKDCDPAQLRSLANVQSVESRALVADGFLTHWIRAARNVDRTLIIAPEIDGELMRITLAMLESDIAIWGATDSFLYNGCDKLALAAAVHPRASYPKTWQATQWQEIANRDAESLESLHGDGWVLKDRFGAGCADIRYFSTAAALHQFLDSDEGLLAPEPRRRRNRHHWMVQRWIPGIPASLSCIADPEAGVKLVGCMGQSIERSEGVCYTGGYGPLLAGHHEFLQEWANSIVAPFSGVRGWFGLDVVICPSRGVDPPGSNSIEIDSLGEFLVGPLHIHLVEINPRLTTSYIGWRNIIGPSLAEGVLGISDAWASCRRIEKQVTFPVPSLP